MDFLISSIAETVCSTAADWFWVLSATFLIDEPNSETEEVASSTICARPLVFTPTVRMDAADCVMAASVFSEELKRPSEPLFIWWDMEAISFVAVKICSDDLKKLPIRLRR